MNKHNLKSLDRWPHERFITDVSMDDRVIVRRNENVIEHNVPHILAHRSQYGFNIGSIGERGQFDVALNIAHHLVRKHKLQRALGTPRVVRTTCGRRTWDVAMLLADYIKWHFVGREEHDWAMDVPTKKILAHVQEVIANYNKVAEAAEDEA